MIASLSVLVPKPSMAALPDVALRMKNFNDLEDVIDGYKEYVKGHVYSSTDIEKDRAFEEVFFEDVKTQFADFTYGINIELVKCSSGEVYQYHWIFMSLHMEDDDYIGINFLCDVEVDSFMVRMARVNKVPADVRNRLTWWDEEWNRQKNYKIIPGVYRGIAMGVS